MMGRPWGFNSSWGSGGCLEAMNSGGSGGLGMGCGGCAGGDSNWSSNGTGLGGGDRHHIHVTGLPFRATQRHC
jgi:hypothetical protein